MEEEIESDYCDCYVLIGKFEYCVRHDPERVKKLERVCQASRAIAMKLGARATVLPGEDIKALQFALQEAGYYRGLERPLGE